MYQNKFFRAVVILMTLTIATGCQQNEKSENTVSVSILPLKYFVDRLTDEKLDVNVMIPPGASHSTYSPTTLQFRKLSDSKLYLGIGSLGYEQAWMPRLNELNPTMQKVVLTKKTRTIAGACCSHGDHHHHEHQIDPHIWMSPKVMIELMPVIKESLKKQYPHLSSTVTKNYASLISDIEALDKELEEVTENAAKRQFIIFHPALTYMARDYDLLQWAMEEDGKEPSPRKIRELIQRTKRESVALIFIQEEYDKRNAELLAKETGLDLIQINPLAYDYVESIRAIISTFKTYLHE